MVGVAVMCLPSDESDGPGLRRFVLMDHEDAARTHPPVGLHCEARTTPLHITELPAPAITG